MIYPGWSLINNQSLQKIEKQLKSLFSQPAEVMKTTSFMYGLSPTTVLNLSRLT